MGWLRELLHLKRNVDVDQIGEDLCAERGTVKGLDQGATAQARFFTTAFSLLAKMAKSDGVVARDEIARIERFMEELGCSPESRSLAISIFRAAKDSNETFAEIAASFSESVEAEAELQTIQEHYDDSRHGRTPYELRLRMFEILHAVAMADGVLRPVEEELLRIARKVFRIPIYKYDEILGLPNRLTDDSQPSGPYAVLGVFPDAPMATIKSRYRQLLHENHPDKLVSQGLPPEFVEMASRRLQAVIDAYEAIIKAKVSC